MGPLGRAARSRVIYSISRVGATRWRQWVGAVALYYPIPSERNKPHATSATVPGETAMMKRLLEALRTGPIGDAGGLQPQYDKLRRDLGLSSSP